MAKNIPSRRDSLNRIPPPESCIVSGRLVEIDYKNGRFRLLVNQGSYLSGRICAESLKVKALRPLLGKQITVEGMVHFKANGQAILIEVRRISRRLEKDGVFEEIPSAKTQQPDDPLSDRAEHASNFDPIELAGAWPGNEPVEELLDQLD